MSSEKMNRIDYIELFDIPEAKEEIEDNKPSFDTTTQSLLSFALPALRWTDRQMQLMLQMSIAPLKLALFLLGNRNVEKGYVHEYRVRELADRLGFERQTLYTAINTLNELGFAKLRIKNKRVSGKILDSPAKRIKDDERAPDVYPLKVATLHTDYLLPFLNAGPTEIILKTFLLTAFHCDEITGELNTEMRPKEWAERLECDRTTSERAFDWILDREFMHIKRDYVVLGRHPGVSMGYWQIRLTNLEKEKVGIENAKRRKKGIQPFEDILLMLRKIFGIDARGWTHGHIAEAQRLFSKKMEAHGLAELRRVKERLGSMGEGASRRVSNPDGVTSDPLSWKDFEADGVPQGA